MQATELCKSYTLRLLVGGVVDIGIVRIVGGTLHVLPEIEIVEKGRAGAIVVLEQDVVSLYARGGQKQHKCQGQHCKLAPPTLHS